MIDKKKIKTYTNCLIVVDMVNGFVKEGVMHDESIAKVVPFQLNMIEDYQKDEQLVVFVRDAHTKKAREFSRFGNTPHCLKGSHESELIEELKPLESKDNTTTIFKNSTSFMEALKFRELLTKLKRIKKYEVIGCCTDICDFNGIMGLANYLDEHDIPSEVNLYLDGVATYNEENRQEYIKAAYLLMAQQGINLIRSKK